ncbi:MAG: ABC-F family ATP-binding cassette domain-containing protein, partial [Candidatus Eremiobacteraeota bacterium]|nr:ABC-F family ATP-binding cassette domain-containing protein [Candidatus Eremiobacteraeota bacterium]
NHLDLYAVEWLEDYLSSYKGTVLMVSHDRAFLDRVVNRVLAFEFGELEDYAGNYTFFLHERDERRERQLAAYQAQQKQLAHDQRFIERFRAKATLASRVKSREKRLEKLERVEAPTGPAKKMKAGFSSGLTSGQELFKVIDLAKSYAGVEVFSQVNFELAREDRLALVGRNGAGKSTLMRLLAGLEEPDAGRVKAGYRVEPVYFAQHQAEALSPHHTVLESLDEVAPPGTTQTRLRTLLGCLLFEADEVFKPVSVLSGGERSRVALARCIIRPSNLLLLDEPTNHLDLDARESLLDALEDYPGTIVLITHDRHFMDGLVTRVLELADHRARVFLGNYSRYRDKVEQERRQAEAAKAAAAKEAKKKPVKKSTPRPTGGRQVGWKLEALEAKIFALEEELESLTAQLADPALYQEGAGHEAVQARYTEVEAQIEELTGIWDTMT